PRRLQPTGAVTRPHHPSECPHSSTGARIGSPSERPMIQPRVELQRILARGPDSLRNNLVVDISSIATWLRHCAPGTPAWSSTVWDELARVIGRSGRRVLWLQVLLQENSEAARIAERLREVAGETALVVQSGES